MSNGKTLLVFPTKLEATGLLGLCESQISDSHFIINQNFHLLISGIGIQKTTFSLFSVLMKFQYDWVINLGLAGSYLSDIELGSLVLVNEETFGDLGVISPNKFNSLFDINLESANDFPFINGIIFNDSNFSAFDFTLPIYRGATVNSLLTDLKLIENRVNSTGAQIESMEGASVFYVCKLLNIKFLQIRVVSNQVGEREKSKWLIKPAIQKLNEFAIQIFQL